MTDVYDYNEQEKVRSDMYTHKFNNSIRCIGSRRQRPQAAGPIALAHVPLAAEDRRMPPAPATRSGHLVSR